MDQETVLKVAKLARIKIAPEKVDLYTREFGRIVDLIQELKHVDTQGLKPLVNVNEDFCAMRSDEISDGNIRDQVLANAAGSKFGYFTVPKVIE